MVSNQSKLLEFANFALQLFEVVSNAHLCLLAGGVDADGWFFLLFFSFITPKAQEWTEELKWDCLHWFLISDPTSLRAGTLKSVQWIYHPKLRSSFLEL